MIQKIGSGLTVKNTMTAKYKAGQNAAVSPVSEKPAQTVSNPSPQLLHSYFISFGEAQKPQRTRNAKTETDDILALSKKLQNKMTPDAKELYAASAELAQVYGSKEISQLHVLRIGLEYTKMYIEALNSGELTYGDAFPSSIPTLFEEELSRKVFKDKVRRNKILPVINKEIDKLDMKLAQNAASQSQGPKQPKPVLSADFVNDIYSNYEQDNVPEANGDRLVHDDTIFAAAMFSNNSKFSRETTTPLLTSLKDSLFIDKRPIEKRIHLKFYDNKAKNIWKNLSVGTNMAIIHDKNVKTDYLVNSFLHTFNEEKNGFGRLNNKNTKVTVFNDDTDLPYLSEFVKKAAKDTKYTHILVFDTDKAIKNALPEEARIELGDSVLGMNDGTADMFLNAGSNLKYVTISDKNSFYAQTNNGNNKNFFADFGEVSLPLINLAEAKKMFKEEPALMEKVKKPFTAQAIQKAVEAADQLSGDYPEKAQKLMDLISAYYVDKKKEINLTDVQNYIKEAKEVFKQNDNDSSVKMLFDTGLKLKDMVGTPSTKKEAQAIVSRIKDKSIGSKGFIIYSQDPRAVAGAGRKYTAKAIAGEARIPYAEIDAVDFGTKEVNIFGAGSLSPEASIKKLFSLVRTQAETNPNKAAVLFIENFEYFSVGEYFTDNAEISMYYRKSMSQLIREMTKAQEDGLNIVVIGSTSSPELVGDSTAKSMKFIDKIEVDTPGINNEARKDVIEYYLKKKGIKLAGNESEKKAAIELLTATTQYSSFLDILTLLDKSKDVAKERKHKEITKSDFTEAYLQLSSGRPAVKTTPEYSKKIVTSHECGHALNLQVMQNLAKKQNIPWHMGNGVNFITLDERGSFGGCVVPKDGGNEEVTFEKIFSEIICAFGGNSCEKHFFNIDGSLGITQDMAMATNSASRAVMLMGMGKHFGKKSVHGMEIMSENDKNLMNKDIAVILKNGQILSDMISEVYEDFNKEFTEKYSPLVGTGECIIHGEDFERELNDWIAKQTPEKKKELELADKAILEVINATKNGIECSKA